MDDSQFFSTLKRSGSRRKQFPQLSDQESAPSIDSVLNNSNWPEVTGTSTPVLQQEKEEKGTSQLGLKGESILKDCMLHSGDNNSDNWPSTLRATG